MSDRRRANPRPIDAARLEEVALAYVARFATSAARLGQYLRRKLRERGWAGEGEPPITALVEKMVGLGFVDDEAFAKAKSGSLLRRGYGARRVDQALNAAGIAKEVRGEVRGDKLVLRAAALSMARKRRLGPYGPADADRTLREKQVATLLRAGHPLDSARILVNSPTIEAAEQWVAEAEDE